MKIPVLGMFSQYDMCARCDYRVVNVETDGWLCSSCHSLEYFEGIISKSEDKYLDNATKFKNRI